MSEDNDYNDNEIDLAALFQEIGKTWKLVVVAVVAATLLITSLLAFFRVAIPSLQTFQQSIGFVFPDVQKGRYPNESPFSLNDLIAPAILSKVYQKNNLSDQKISLAQFSAGVNVMPHASTINEAIARYRARLSNKKLTFIERQNIEKEMAQELADLSGRNCLIRLTLKKRFGIPNALGLKLVTDIAKEWADYSINNLGVLKLPGTLERQTLIDPKFLKSLDYPVAADFLNKSALDLLARIDVLTGQSASGTLVDKKSGFTPLSLKRDVQRYIDYELNNLVGPISGESHIRFPKVTLWAFQHRLDTLKLNRDMVLQKVEGLTVALRNYKQVSPATVDNKSAGNEDHSSAAPVSTPQLSEGFLDRIMKLSNQDSERKFRENLILKQIKLQDEVVEISHNMGILQRTIRVLEKNLNNNIKEDSNDLEARKKVIDKLLPLAANSLNRYWEISGQLLEKINIKNFSYSGHLYQLQATPNSISTYHPIFNKKTVTIILLLLVGIAIFAMFIGLIQQRLQRK